MMIPSQSGNGHRAGRKNRRNDSRRLATRSSWLACLVFETRLEGRLAGPPCLAMNPPPMGYL